MIMSDTTTKLAAGKSKIVERLEVEDDDRRQARMHSVFVQLDSKVSHQGQSTSNSFDFGDRTTFAVDPPSELLSRVQAFLPELAASNAELSRKAKENPHSIDIENVDDENRYIEMNLGLGVFESRSKTQSNTAGNSIRTGPGIDVEMSNGSRTSQSFGYTDSNSDSDSDMSEDDSSDSETSSVDIISSLSSSLSRPIRPLPRRSTNPRPEIIVLDSRDTSSASSSEESH
ncbi:hypothetical protein QCA50_010123 [Cerrena zonata]|uniref:Uncharacterized protein n=1 Tax=Cerrena zonata TaxID=2478898 RepID=A0AAW0G596_9APHY